MQLPVALEIAVYVASGGIVVLVVGLVIGFLYVKKRVDHVVRSAEELRSIVEPMARELKVTAQRIGRLTARAEEKWLAVESAIETVRDYGRQANRLIEESVAAVAVPVHAASRTAQILTTGMQTFLQVMFSRSPYRQAEQKGRES
jgi:uncharacterized protein YoxC